MTTDPKLPSDLKPIKPKVRAGNLYYQVDYDFITCELPVDENGFIVMPKRKRKSLVAHKS